MVVAEHISDGAKEDLRHHGIAYFDASGTLYLKYQNWLIDIQRPSKPVARRGAVHNWFREKRVTAELLDGAGTSTEVVRHADVTAYIILKASAFDQRGENKDAGDLVHVMRYAGTPAQIAEEIVARYQTGKHTQAIMDTLAVLETRFCDGDGVEGHLRNGPIAAARFQLGLDQDDEEARVLEQRGVAGLVTEIVARIRDRLAAETKAD